MTMQYTNDESTYYTDQEMARLLGISLGRLRNKLTAGQPLPPRIQPPGCRHRLWPCQAVHAWLEQYTITTADSPVCPVSTRRHGHPRKQEARSRRS